MRIEKLYVQCEKLLAGALFLGFIAVGCLITFSVPPFQIPDENHHWSAELTRIENVLHKPAYFDAWRGLVTFFDVDRVQANPGEKIARGIFERSAYTQIRAPFDKFIGYGNVTSYPQVILACLIEGWNASSDPGSGLRALYLARLFGGLMTLIPMMRLLVLSLSSRKNGLLTALAFSLSALFVQQSFAVSSDSVCNAFAWWMLLIILGGKQLTRADWIFSLTFSVLAAGTKPMMGLLAAAAFIFRWTIDADEKADSAQLGRERTQLIAICVAVLFIGGAVTFSYLSKRMYFVHFLSGHLLSGSFIVLQGLWNRSLQFRDFGGLMGWAGLPVSVSTSQFWFILLLFGLSADILVPGHFVVPRNVRIVRKKIGGALTLLAGAVLCAFSISWVMYLHYFDKTADQFFLDLRARYFLPPLLLCIAGFHQLLTVARKEDPEISTSRLSTGTGETLSASGKAALACWGFVFLILLFSYMVSVYLDIARRYW